MEVIKELWYGTLNPMEIPLENTDECRELVSLVSRHEQNLLSALDEKQLDTFEKLNDCRTELTIIREYQVFCNAFKLGMRFAIESLSD